MKRGPALMSLAIGLILAVFCVHAARSGFGLPSRGFLRFFADDPAVIWWSAALITGGAWLYFLRLATGAFGPGKTITLTDENLADLDWDIISVKVPNQHAAAAPRCLELVRRALQAYGYHGDLSGIREVRVKLPSPTFT